jgi:hypothetical protein
VESLEATLLALKMRLPLEGVRTLGLLKKEAKPSGAGLTKMTKMMKISTSIKKRRLLRVIRPTR